MSVYIFVKTECLFCFKAVYSWYTLHIFILYLFYLNSFNRNYNFKYYGVMVTQVTTFLFLYSCNINITLKIAGMSAEKCW